MAPRRAGLFLDLDGTLADSLSVMRKVYERFLAHFGHSGSDAEFDRLNGPPLTEVIADLARTHAIDQPMAALQDLYRDLIAAAYDEVAPSQGGAALLGLARQGGIPVAIVTSNASYLAWSWLRRVGLAELVETVIGGDDVRRGKPDPEPYLTALERTGCAAAASLAVEDSPIGARSAVAAGLPTVLLAGPDAKAPPGVVVVERLAGVAAVLRDRGLMIQASPLRPAVTVRVMEPFEPPPVIQERIDTIWAAEMESRGGRLTDGRVYGLLDGDADCLRIQPARYRHVLARRRACDLVSFRPLAVTGVLLCADGLVLGRRGDGVAADSGLWEPAPAGGLSHPDPAGQILEELREELGLEPDQLVSSEACGLVEDRDSGVVDIVFRLRTVLSGEDVRAAHRARATDEYGELAIVPLSRLADFLQVNRNRLLPALRPILGLAGLL